MDTRSQRRVAVISMHADPTAALGSQANGGMNLIIRRVAQELSQRGLATDIFVRRTDLTAPDVELIAPLARVIRITAGPTRPLSRHRLSDLAPEFAEAVMTRPEAEDVDYELIHGHYWLSGLVAGRLQEAWQLPWMQSFHTLIRTKQAAGLEECDQRALAEHEQVQNADLLLASSQAEAQELISRYLADPGHIEIARPGTDFTKVTGDTQIALPAGRLLLFAGRLEPLKGGDTFIGAAAELLAQADFSDVVAAVVGGDSDPGEQERLRSQARLAGIADRVQFVGQVAHEQLADYYSRASVCVVPSRAETFGLVAVEALGTGTPVVASNVGGLPEIVENNVNGFLISGHDPHDFATAIARILRDKSLAERFSQNAITAAKRFEWSQTAARFEEIYQVLVSSKRSAAA